MIRDAHAPHDLRVCGGPLAPAARSDKPPPWPENELHAIGWLGPTRFGIVAKEVVVRDILDSLATIGIAISDSDRAELLR